MNFNFISSDDSLFDKIKKINSQYSLDEEIISVNIPTGIPLVYEFDDNFKVINKYYLGNQDLINAKINSVANQAKKK